MSSRTRSSSCKRSGESSNTRSGDKTSSTREHRSRSQRHSDRPHSSRKPSLSEPEEQIPITDAPGSVPPPTNTITDVCANCANCGGPASLHCNTCSTEYCATCGAHVHAPPALARHLPLTPLTVAPRPPPAPPSCPAHPGQPLVYWCATCATPACADCAACGSHGLGHTVLPAPVALASTLRGVRDTKGVDLRRARQAATQRLSALAGALVEVSAAAAAVRAETAAVATAADARLEQALAVKTAVAQKEMDGLRNFIGRTTAISEALDEAAGGSLSAACALVREAATVEQQGLYNSTQIINNADPMQILLAIPSVERRLAALGSASSAPPTGPDIDALRDTSDLPHEMLGNSYVTQRLEAAERLLRLKDVLLDASERERSTLRERAQAQSAAAAAAAAAAQRASQIPETRLECIYCGQRLRVSNVNGGCPCNVDARAAPQPGVDVLSVGDGHHWWVCRALEVDSEENEYI